MQRIQVIAALVDQLRADLVRYGVATWPEILAEWGEMLSRVRTNEEATAVFKHIHEGLWGMGRLADVVIAPETGHAGTVDEYQLYVINEEFMSLVKALSHEVSVQSGSRDKVIR